MAKQKSCNEEQERKLIYQIYPTAIGDLNDIADKIPLIAKLKPDYIWLSPVYFSPWIDGGYDVADYKRIDPRFGNLRDFSRLVATAKKYNIGILMDLVLNHTSIQHEWFKRSVLYDHHYKDYYIWLDKGLNWNSFFGGPAFSYNSMRGQFYLHLYDESQPDLNFSNPSVIKEFKDIIKYWKSKGVAGFRVDSANVLIESRFTNGIIPRLSGFLNYYQSKETIAVLEDLFSDKDLFYLAEPVGGDFMTKRHFRDLTKNAFNASFNIGTLDVADTFMSNKESILPIDYKKWFTKLAEWSQEPKFSLALESHDTPRATTRFKANAKTLALLQFSLPGNFPCIYQGQELGTKNADLSNDITDYPGIQSRMIYRRLRRDGKTKAEAMRIVRRNSRDNARQPIDWGEYYLQTKNPDSNYNFYLRMIELWRNDPILKNGKIKVNYMNEKGVFNFERILGDRKYLVHIDMSNRTASYIRNQSGEKIIKTR